MIEIYIGMHMQNIHANRKRRKMSLAIRLDAWVLGSKRRKHGGQTGGHDLKCLQAKLESTARLVRMTLEGLNIYRLW